VILIDRKGRPIIFIAHSFGGLLVSQVSGLRAVGMEVPTNKHDTLVTGQVKRRSTLCRYIKIYQRHFLLWNPTWRSQNPRVGEDDQRATRESASDSHAITTGFVISGRSQWNAITNSARPQHQDTFILRTSAFAIRPKGIDSTITYAQAYYQVLKLSRTPPAPMQETDQPSRWSPKRLQFWALTEKSKSQLIEAIQTL
jgi:hypothetical protein